MSTITIGLVSYTVYLDDLEADIYFNTRVNYASWAAIPTAIIKQRSIISATSYLERMPWAGAKVSDSQPLAWPRTGVIVRGVEVGSLTIPPDIIAGCAELALALYLNPGLMTKATSAKADIKRVKAGPAEVEFFRGDNADRFPLSVGEFLSAYLVTGGGAGIDAAASSSTGTGACSSFEDDDEFGLNGSF